jgi:hypothetical protein
MQALAKKDPVRRQVLRVKGCLAGSKAENLLEQGDMILAINKEPITCFLDIENACQKLDQSIDSDGVLNMTIFRQVRTIYKNRPYFYNYLQCESKRCTIIAIG